ncbi:tetratricopeptide repeat protein [Candidatus Pelagibacter sp.]|nr:tetratricopeptide repeat protein [Candidatus Pelagibacter sp.]|tara:strand:+ start:40 stop:591 length:552 start_codon:yes stop_codon:yes gene_type:complete
MKIVKSITFLFILFLITSSKAQDRDLQLDKLFNELKVNNEALTYGIEQKIWEIWSTHPNDHELTKRLTEGSSLVRNKQLLKAVNIFTEVIDLDPTWAEAWNKRATVLYMMGDYKRSQEDIDKVLELEQRHFGALAGQGLINIKLENYEKAIESYKKAQEIYPTMRSLKIMIEKIKELINQNLI